MKRLGLGSGIALCLFSGVLFGDAWMGGSRTLWSAGALAVLAGALLTAAAACSRGEPPRVLTSPPARRFHAAELPAPLLGDLLVRRALVSPSDLGKALALQQGTSKRLGDVLVAMGLIAADELDRVMEEQRAYRQRGFAWRG